MSNTDDTAAASQVLLNLLSGFYWFDEGLQSYIRACGWPEVTRPQSMVMANVVMGVRHPSEIARRLGISRQAIHATLKSMIGMGMVRLADDPGNMRVKVVELTPTGEAMRRDAQLAMKIMIEKLVQRIGQEAFDKTAATLAQDWGRPLSFRPEDVVPYRDG
ncbi:MAG: MarR family transcriptional regulator [Alphaproteobacteria bacterium HGW-Alphaproteobacteria-18]|nr:MAG: MarR family transcriptional regulator [Alphaproteobacteria bacterium HGW-Alphaproteobacteria-18]